MNNLAARPAWFRPALAAGVGIVVGTALAFKTHWQLSLLCGWLGTATTFLALTWFAVHDLDPDETRELAAREDPSRATTDLVLIVASLISLGSVALVIATSGKSGTSSSLAQIAVGVLSVLASWTVVHTLYTLRYARLYFTDGDEGGIDFGSDKRPQYADFAYVAFTLGMTYQVSDTALKTSNLRSTALRQALLSYLFGTVIIAVTINLVAGLIK
jgi:uncharacterized membrane protein